MSPTCSVAEARSSRRWPALAVIAVVLLFTVAPALPAASASHQHGTVAGRIDRFLTTQLKQSAIPGAAVAVTRGDRVLMARGHGRDSAPTAYRNQRDEVSVLPELFSQAQALTTLGDRPLAVLTASATNTGSDG